ncbi:MAG: DUF350 domain-containing protein [Melioribacteraceae bacterium]|nr:DUF350 domain-containing protein [Melioribacteraceae bacterium]
MLTTFDDILTSLVYLASCFIIFMIGKFVYQLFHKDIDVKNELVEKDNFAFAVAHTGYFIGLLFAIGSAIIGPSAGMRQDLIDIFSYGLLGIILLNLSIIINDKIILRKFSVTKEIIEDKNTGTGVIEAANAVATGLIILGALSGEGGSYLTAIVFWLIGQVLLFVVSIIYNLITPYNIHEHIEKDNVAVGVGFSGAIVAIGVLIWFALSPDFIDWQTSLMNLLVDVVIGLVLLPIVRIVTDKILLPGRKLTDEIVNQEKPNVGVALIEAFAYIGGAVFITWCL